MKLSELGSTVESLPGVGPKMASLFARMNIFTVADLLETYPRDYEDRTKNVPLKDFASSKIHTICKVTAHSWFGYGRMKTLKISITDGTTEASLIAFNRPFLQKSLPEGSIISVTGKFDVKYNELQSTAFEAERISYEGELSEWQNAPVPNSGVLSVYPLTEGLSQKHFRKAVGIALRQYGKAVEDEIPSHLISERNLLHKSEALLKIHEPQNLSEAEEARHTLIYEELFLFEKKMALRTLEHRGTLPTFSQAAVFDTVNGAPDAGSRLQVPEESEELLTERFTKSLSPRQKQLLERLPFKLTRGQMSVITEMNEDIDRSAEDLYNLQNKPEKLQRSPFNMQRLVQGDVGSGKTLVAFFMCLREIDYGGQCALLAPTELLARQHAENAAKLLEPLGVRVAFLTGNIKAKGRELLVNALKDGNIDIVVGTHALFSRNTQYKNLLLAVIDEQHRFGVAQRESIVDKGRVTADLAPSDDTDGTASPQHVQYTHTPDTLMMSATPIPQTLALTAFGDLDISTIHTMPNGRIPIKTYLSIMGHENNVYEAVRKEILAGHQAYFVYPRIGEAEDDAAPGELALSNGIKGAEETFSFLSTQVYPGIPCALVHSKIPEDEQHRILDEFKNGTTKILVATTVVEVGVDVPNATCIVIEHAERFGLAELHQLRGRVGRGSFQSYCFLIYSRNITEDGIARMKALHESTDGFKIAEEDLILRGPGQVNGTQQSGYLTLHIADLSRDRDTLTQARYDAFTEVKKSF